MRPSKFHPKRRTYSELCPIALSLEVVGDRWTLLIIRELFAGPKRFTDLADGLPGIGTAILTERLRELDRCGLVSRRRLGPPAPARVYQLTERGVALDVVMQGLARWGAVYLPGQARLPRRGRWLLQAMASTATSAIPPGIETTNFVLDGEHSHILVGKKRVGARDGQYEGAGLTIRGTSRDLYRLATTRNRTDAALKGFTVEGDWRSASGLMGYLRSGMPGVSG